MAVSETAERSQKRTATEGGVMCGVIRYVGRREAVARLLPARRRRKLVKALQLAILAVLGLATVFIPVTVALLSAAIAVKP